MTGTVLMSTTHGDVTLHLCENILSDRSPVYDLAISEGGGSVTIPTTAPNLARAITLFEALSLSLAMAAK